MSPYTSRSGRRWSGNEDDADKHGGRHDESGRRGRHNQSGPDHDWHGTHAARCSRTPESSPRRKSRHLRDHDYDNDRNCGRERSPHRDRKTRHSGDERRSRREMRHSGEDRRIDRRQAPDEQKDPVKHRRPLPSQHDSFAVETGGDQAEKPKERPNWGNSGLLAAASNSVLQADGTSTALKYHEPTEARKPPARDQWKLFVFKQGEIVDTIDLNHQSCWLVGSDQGVVDVVAEHPSISKQHAVIQFRYIEKKNEFGDKTGKVKPYLLDLKSSNGTILNEATIPQRRYLELRHKDMIVFGNSTREYIVMLAPRD